LTLFDIIVLCLLGVSALIGFARGAVREITTVVAFIVAAFAAIFALRFVGPMARAALHPAWMGNTAALLVVFLVVYIVLRVISGGMIRSLHSTAGLGMLDRLIGGGFGLVRGLIILGLINMAIHLAPPAAGAPGWIVGAKLYPLSGKCADAIRAIAPKGSEIAHRLTPEIEKAVKSGDGDSAASSDGGQSGETSYDHAARKGLDDVVEKLR
jgi:membrane protein required for colicin V production